MLFISLFLCAAAVCSAQRAPDLEHVESVCYVNHPQNEQCGPHTPSYCDQCSTWSGCPGNGGSGPGFGLRNLTDGVREREIYFTEREYFLYKQLTLDYTIEFMKNPMPGDTAVALPYCGLRKPSAGNRKEKRGWWKDVQHYVQTHDPFADRPKRPTLTPKPVCLPTEISVPMHFSVFTAEYSTAQLVTMESLQKQVTMMNDAFALLGISFWIKSVHFHSGEQYQQFVDHRHNSASAAEFEYNESIKQQHHYGGDDEVNIYVVEKIDDVSCSGPSMTETSGYCSLAQYLNTPGHMTDGCVVIIDELPGLSFRAKGTATGRGKTLIHELGHWFGLEHTFATGAKCEGTSDTAEDTIRFPSDPAYLFAANQPTCCLNGNKWGYCSGPNGAALNIIHNSNWMSYSPDMGNGVTDDPGARPWTNDQRREMYVNYYTFRKREKEYNAKYVGKCFNHPVYDDLPIEFTTRDLQERNPNVSNFVARKIRGTKAITYRGPAMVETLKKICQNPPVEGLFIDSVTGESVQCNPDTSTCEAPSKGWLCLDGSQPPCTDYVPEKSYPQPRCEDGSAPPCAERRPVCKGNEILTCALPNGVTDPGESPSDPGKQDPDPNKPDPSNPGTAVCPKTCNIHSNTCDATTAPTCVYPDPSAKNPRPACACRPGYKASAYADTDTSYQWRVPVVGQEHRVWVAEGVKCDKLCTISWGVDSCKEVTLIDKSCVG